MNERIGNEYLSESAQKYMSSMDKFADWLDEVYKNDNLNFRCMGIQIQIEPKETVGTKQPYITACIAMPDNMVFTDEYKKYLHEYAIQHCIKQINRQLTELKNESISN